MRMITMVAVASMALASAASAETDSAFLNGGDYMSLTPDQRTIYVMGLADMMSRMSRAVENSDELAFQDRTRRCTGEMGRVQLRDFIDAYMALDPAYKGYGMASNFRAAINEKCPQ